MWAAGDPDVIDNVALRALVRRWHSEIPSRRPEGWTSPATLFREPETLALQRFIFGSCPPATELQGWANLLQPGDSLGWHDHRYPANLYSGVYFLQSGGGTLEFEDGTVFEPVESRLIWFPCALKHRVKATAERLSIAFNAR